MSYAKHSMYVYDHCITLLLRNTLCTTLCRVNKTTWILFEDRIFIILKFNGKILNFMFKK